MTNKANKLNIALHEFYVDATDPYLNLITCSFSENERRFLENWASSVIDPLTGESISGKPCDPSLFSKSAFKRLPMSGMYKAHKGETDSYTYFGIFPTTLTSERVVFAYDKKILKEGTANVQ